MKLLELHINGFGKIHDRTISFSDGINVIYGRAIGNQLPMFPQLQPCKMTLLVAHSPAIGQQPVAYHLPCVGGKLGQGRVIGDSGSAQPHASLLE